MTEDEVDAVLKSADSNRDGKLNYKEVNFAFQFIWSEDVFLIFEKQKSLRDLSWPL
jgi:hypothetical protein